MTRQFTVRRNADQTGLVLTFFGGSGESVEIALSFAEVDDLVDRLGEQRTFFAESEMVDTTSLLPDS